MFENKVIKGIHTSRYIMSYIRAGGKISKRAGYSEFEDWLGSLPLSLTDEEIDYISSMGRNGKLELEIDAKKFLADDKSWTNKKGLRLFSLSQSNHVL